MSYSEYLPDTTSSILLGSNVCLAYYIIRHHREHFVYNILDTLLTSATYLRQFYHQFVPIPKPKIRLTKVHLIANSWTDEINSGPEPIEILNFDQERFKNNSQHSDYFHICYTYLEKPFRIILKSDQFDLLDRITEETMHPKLELDEVNFSNTKEQLHDCLHIIEQYGGPLGDFYEYLEMDNVDEIGKYLLTEDCKKYILKGDMKIKVTNTLGNEYVFSK